MSSSILHTELNKNNIPSKCYHFWGIVDNNKDLFETIHKKILNHELLYYLENLNQNQAKFFYYLLINKGNSTLNDLLNDKIFQNKEEIDTIAEELNEISLIFIRKSISQIKIVANSYFIYNEIYQYLKSIPIKTIQDLIINHQTLQSHQQQKQFFSYNLNKLLFINSGQFHYPTIMKSKFKDEIINSMKNDFFQIALLYDNSFFSIISTPLNYLNNLKCEQPNHKPLQYHMQFLVNLYHIYYYIKIKGLYATSKTYLRKHDYNQLLKILNNDDKLLDFTLKYINDNHFVETIDLKYIETDKYRQFLRNNTHQKYSFLLNLSQELKTTYRLIIKMSKTSFQINDLAMAYFLDHLENKGYFSYHLEKNEYYSESKITNALNTLVLMGFLDFKKNEYHLNSISNCYINDIKYSNYESAEKDAIVVNNNHSIMVYPEKINPYHHMIIELFADHQNKDKVWLYEFDKTTIQRGKYFGLDENDFIECLEFYSTKKIADNIIYNIQNWAKKIKKVKIKQITVLEGDKESLQIIQHDPSLKKYFIPINDNYLQCINFNFPHNVENDQSIYILNQDEDLTYEKD